ncbi:hypothetical protein [Argonema antarcticum]|uniref:hypothetical protein n=1 Tax=Argonema antarcticum TaxID=2942763 RepID=UPI002010F0E9|nr:hypothetical protein [Argonema antarcticum]MCL1474277.1 hypothetical protein [Argonema antarcticum A004/B2]
MRYAYGTLRDRTSVSPNFPIHTSLRRSHLEMGGGAIVLINAIYRSSRVPVNFQSIKMDFRY